MKPIFQIPKAYPPDLSGSNAIAYHGGGGGPLSTIWYMTFVTFVSQSLVDEVATLPFIRRNLVHASDCADTGTSPRWLLGSALSFNTVKCSNSNEFFFTE